jgi:hypothetical protein
MTLRTDENARWHWEEGNKYVVEGGKTLFWLNGAAAAGLLTFLGNAKEPITCGLRVAIVFFALGSLCAAVLFLCGYVAQLHYGKDAIPIAERWHVGGYISAVLGVVLFAGGVVVAAFSLR